MEKTNIYQKLLHIQTNLKAPKNQYNEFGRFNYRSCEDILEGLKPLLKETSCTLFIKDTVNQISTRFYITATVTFIDCETGEKIEVEASAREEDSKRGMDGSQVTGATSSYARKYALNALFCIDDVKDPDYAPPGGKGASKTTRAARSSDNKEGAGKLDEEKISALYAELKRTGVGLKGVLEKNKVHSLIELTDEQYKDTMAKLKSMKSKEQAKEKEGEVSE